MYVKSEMNESTVQGSLLCDALPVIGVTQCFQLFSEKTSNQTKTTNNKTAQEVNDKNTIMLNMLQMQNCLSGTAQMCAQ